MTFRRRPEDVGDACVFLASPLASWIIGHHLVVAGGGHGPGDVVSKAGRHREQGQAW